MITFSIDQRLPSLNEYIKRINANKFQGAKFKQEQDTICFYSCLQTARKIRTLSDKEPVYIEFEWHEENRRRDVDNIYSAKKYILDGMQAAGALKNDDPAHVADVRDKLIYDSTGLGCVIVRIMTKGEFYGCDN